MATRTSSTQTSKRPAFVIFLLALGALSAYLVLGGHVYTMTSGSDAGFFLTMGMMLFAGMSVFAAGWLTLGALLSRSRPEMDYIANQEPTPLHAQGEAKKAA